MGGRGGTSGLADKNRDKKWNYVGFQEATQKAEQEFAQLKKDQNKFSEHGIHKRVHEIVNYIDGSINAISKEIADHATKNGDEKVLYAEKRKLRILRKQLIAFGSNR